jgi:O-antigen/teichoic acid export membrane protein
MADDLVNIAEESARGGFLLISGTAISTVVMAVASILIGRLLGPELYGQYTLALVAPQLLYIFTDLGINQGLTKFTAALNSRNETYRLAKVIRNAMLLKALTGVILFAINYALADVFAQIMFQRPDIALYIRIASFAILFQVIFSTATSAFVGLDKSEYAALTSNVQALAKTIISIALVLLGLGVAGSVLGSALSYAAAATSGTLLLYLVMRRRKLGAGNDYDSNNDLRQLVRYGIPLYISVLLTGFTPLFQNLILANFTTDTDIGNYKAALNFATLITVLSVPITTALLPAFSKIDSTATDKLKLFFKHANKYTVLLIMPITILLVIYSTQVVQIVYGSTYQSASLFLATYCPLYFMVGIGYLTLTSLYNGIGETKTTFIISLITFLVIAVSSPILTQMYGVQGLIAAFLAGSLTGTVYALARAKRRFQIELDSHALIKVYLISTISALPSLLLLRFTALSNLATFIVGGSIYLFIYATLIPLARIVTHHELESATKIISRIRLLRLIADPILKYQKRILKRQ